MDSEHDTGTPHESVRLAVEIASAALSTCLSADSTASYVHFKRYKTEEEFDEALRGVSLPLGVGPYVNTIGAHLPDDERTKQESIFHTAIEWVMKREALMGTVSGMLKAARLSELGEPSRPHVAYMRMMEPLISAFHELDRTIIRCETLFAIHHYLESRGRILIPRACWFVSNHENNSASDTEGLYKRVLSILGGESHLF